MRDLNDLLQSLHPQAPLAARHLWRDAVQRRWGHRLHRLHAGLARDGAFYLFSLRVAPVIPFALINPLMGLSAMCTRRKVSLPVASSSAAPLRRPTMPARRTR